MAFGGAFSENYGALPSWAQAPAFTASLARLQAIWRAGKPDIDIAILRHSYWDNGHAKASPGFDYWQDKGLDQAGYTHDYVSPAVLALPQWMPLIGRAAPGGPRYRAVVVMPGQALPVATLQRLAATAVAGVPVLIAGDGPVPPGLSTNAASFAQALKVLRAMPQVHQIPDPGSVSRALAQMGAIFAKRTNHPAFLAD